MVSASFKYYCDTNQGLMVKVGEELLRCQHKDQVLEFTINSNPNERNFAVYFGNIVCPSCEEICGVSAFLSRGESCLATDLDLGMLKDEIKCPSVDHLSEIEKRSSNTADNEETYEDFYPSSYIRSKRDYKTVLLFDKAADSEQEQEHKSMYKHSKKVEYGSNSGKHDEYVQNQHDYCLKKLSTFSSSLLSSSSSATTGPQLLSLSFLLVLYINTFLSILINLFDFNQIWVLPSNHQWVQQTI